MISKATGRKWKQVLKLGETGRQAMLLGVRDRETRTAAA